MKIRLAWFGLLAMLTVAPAAVLAASEVSGIMRNWRTQTRTLDAVSSGRAAFDQATVRAALTAFSTDAGRIGAEIKGSSAGAKDIRRRFLAFRARADVALSNVQRPAVLKADVSQLKASCQSCHDQYKN